MKFEEEKTQERAWVAECSIELKKLLEDINDKLYSFYHDNKAMRVEIARLITEKKKSVYLLEHLEEELYAIRLDLVKTKNDKANEEAEEERVEPNVWVHWAMKETNQKRKEESDEGRNKASEDCT